MTTTTQGSLLELVTAATLAPSSHNTQPWRFRVLEHAIELVADRTRALPVNDPDDRELTISCGAALFNLRVAAAHTGLTADVALWPDNDEADCVARVRLLPAGGAAPAEAVLHPALVNRRTYRRRFADRGIETATVQRLTDAAAAEGARLVTILDDKRRRAVAGLVSEGDACSGRVRVGDGWRRRCTRGGAATGCRCPGCRRRPHRS